MEDDLGEVRQSRETRQEVAAKREETVYFTTIFFFPPQKWQEKSDEIGLI